jgi:hypothetical protein
MTKSLPVVWIVLLLVTLAACERGDQRQKTESEATADTLSATVTPGEDEYYQKEGNFQIAWPSGCNRLRIRTLPRPTADDPDHLAYAHIFCNREGYSSEGCAVTVYFDQESDFGGPAGPPQVIELVKQLMEHFGVEAVRQQPVYRDDIAGILVHCREPNDTGRVWIEGFLLGSDAYLVSAWQGEGNLFSDPDYVQFFESFKVRRPRSE